MKLLTKEVLNNFKKTGSQEHLDDPKIIVKFFGGGSYSYYATEYNPDTEVFFGYATGLGSSEWGYTSLAELQAVKFAPFGLGIERDLYFGEKRFSEIR